MPKYVSNPPDAAALMTSARSFGNYDLAGAIADLIDNSIKAKARTVTLTCDFNDGSPEIRILDDGTGMSSKELKAAMRPASTNPLEERSPEDLGRFGWGLKSASFSQCRRLTVISHRRDAALSGAVWDLTDITGWSMGVLSSAESRDSCDPKLHTSHGTEVIWRDCDRLSEGRALESEAFNELIVHARKGIALIFHRFLAGRPVGRKLAIILNGTAIAPSDPFYRKHDATQELEKETLRVAGARITIQPFILPHYSKLKSTEQEMVAGEEGLLKNQGFYIYRNHRLILYGTWFRLMKHGELSQLVRISIDIPNSLDSEWKLTLDKSDAQLPAALRKRLGQVVAGLRKRSSSVHSSKGGKLGKGGPTPIWQRFARHGEIRYAINRDHPLIQALRAKDERDRARAITASLLAIEQDFPVGTFGADASDDISAIHQTFPNEKKFREFLAAALPPLLVSVDGKPKQLVKLLKNTEPFSSQWTVVEEFLKAEGISG